MRRIAGSNVGTEDLNLNMKLFGMWGLGQTRAPRQLLVHAINPQQSVQPLDPTRDTDLTRVVEPVRWFAAVVVYVVVDIYVAVVVVDVGVYAVVVVYVAVVYLVVVCVVVVMWLLLCGCCLLGCCLCGCCYVVVVMWLLLCGFFVGFFPLHSLTHTLLPHLSSISPSHMLQVRAPEDYRLILRQPSGCNVSDCNIFVGIDTNVRDEQFLDIYMEAEAQAWVAVGFTATRTMVRENGEW